MPNFTSSDPRPDIMLSHICPKFIQILLFFVLTSGEDEEERINLMKSRDARLLVGSPAVATVMYQLADTTGVIHCCLSLFPTRILAPSITPQHGSLGKLLFIPFGDHPITLEQYSE